MLLQIMEPSPQASQPASEGDHLFYLGKVAHFAGMESKLPIEFVQFFIIRAVKGNGRH